MINVSCICVPVLLTLLSLLCKAVLLSLKYMLSNTYRENYFNSNMIWQRQFPKECFPEKSFEMNFTLIVNQCFLILCNNKICSALIYSHCA